MAEEIEQPTDLTWATTTEVIRELQKRFAGTVIVLEKENGNLITSFTGGSSRALGMMKRMESDIMASDPPSTKSNEEELLEEDDDEES